MADPTAARLEALARRGRAELRAEAVAEADIRLEPSLDMRYRGQSYELIVPFGEKVYADAQAEFQRVRNDMYVIARQLWSRYFPLQPLPPDDAAGRRETSWRVSSTEALSTTTTSMPGGSESRQRPISRPEL